ncbi:MAG: TIGR03915 family putative DNA repair protein [Lachnospiraceae bacterium]|nr:TIGR03915 family putative DNA repair protein [Lachnospiraceae bacterium]
MEEIYLICEDSLEGIFSGVYEAYLLKKSHDQIHLCVGGEDNYRLFATYTECPADDGKAAKVARTVVREFGEETYLALCRAMASTEPDKAEAVYKTIVVGFAMKNRRQLMGNLANKYVHRVFELARFTANEAHAHVEFIRFSELENKILYSKIGPQNNIITFVMPHFADRLPLENFVIYDETRNIYAIHPAKGDWYLYCGEMGEIGEMPFSEGEEKYSELFCHFFHSIAIKERRNTALQRNMLPIRYRKYMTEFSH